MTLKRRRLSKRNHDIDPMSSAVNMTDVMLVLQSAMQAAQQTTELDEETTPLDTKPEEIQSSVSGYQERGKVYQDPSTGKLVLVKSSWKENTIFWIWIGLSYSIFLYYK